MNKFTKLCLAGALAFGLVGCSNNSNTDELETLKVICTANPHGEILNEAKPILAEKYNIDLVITESDDYYIQNRAVSDGEQDANYFQHRVY